MCRHVRNQLARIARLIGSFSVHPAICCGKYSCGKTLFSIDIASLCGNENTSLNRISRIVTEHGNAVHQLSDILFIRWEISLLHRACRCFPWFTVDKNLLAARHPVQCCADRIHGFRIVQRHQIKTESVNVIFLRPVANRAHHKTAEHLPLTRRLVSAVGAIGNRAVLPLTVIIVRNGFLKRRIEIVRMIVYHIHNHADAGLMQRLNHFLHFPDTYLAVERIGCIRALRHIVLYRVITPVECFRIVFRHTAEIKNRKEMHMRNAKRFQVIEPGRMNPVAVQRCAFFRKGQKLSTVLIRNTGMRITRKILHMKLIHATVLRPDFRPFILLPAHRVRLCKIYYHTPLRINTGSHAIRICRIKNAI